MADYSEIENILAQYAPQNPDGESSALRNALAGPTTERGYLWPWMKEGDKLSPAVPGIIHEPWEAVQRLLTQAYYPTGSGDAAPVGDALAAAGAVALPSLGLNVAGMMPKNALGVFGGQLAKTADRAALARAEEMAAKGAPRDDIWDKTGWFQGKDGQWKFEIDDSNAALGNRQKGRLSSVMEHDPLYAAYPDIGKTPTTGLGGWLGMLTGGGYMEPRPKWFGLSQDRGQMVYSKAYEGDARLNKLLHETQHAVQGAEDFGRGANTRTAATGLSDQDVAVLRDRWRQLADAERERLLGHAKRYEQFAAETPRSEDRQRYLAQRDKYLKEAHGADAPMRKFFKDDESFLHDLAYDVSAGEVEARNVEKRRTMTPEQRKASPPWETEDIPLDQQLVRRGR